MEGIRPIFIMIVDISGYTRFIQYHRISMIHAEKIIGELMESILTQVEVPVISHEILGDAITFYSIDSGETGQADKIYHQLQQYFDAFREREAQLISECKLCRCDACLQVGKLKLKAILHYGQAVFTNILGTQKISGVDVITSHRLLKNTVPSKEYILMTPAFTGKCAQLDTTLLTSHIEVYDDIGQVRTYIHDFNSGEVLAAKMNPIKKLLGFLAIEGHLVKRLFLKQQKVFTNLPA